MSNNVQFLALFVTDLKLPLAAKPRRKEGKKHEIAKTSQELPMLSPVTLY